MQRNYHINLIVGALAIIILCIIVFSPLINNGFIDMDDSYYVMNNEQIKDLSIENFLNYFHTKTAGNIHPLTMLSLSIDYHYWGLDSTAYHIHNLILHILNSILVFLLIYKLSQKKLLLALFSALIFAVHPMHVESVAWISERKDVLYSFWYLLGLLSYIYYLKTKQANVYLLTFFCFVFSLLSKSAAVSFPLNLVLIDYLFEKSFTFKSLYSKSIFFISSLGFGLINLKSQGIMMSGYTDFSIFEKIIYSSQNIIWYIVQFFIPHNLSMFHEFPKGIPMQYYLYVFLSFIFILFIVYSIIRKKNMHFVFGSLFFLFSILFMLHIVAFSKAITAARYTYLAYIGILWFILNIILYKKDGSERLLFGKRLILPTLLSIVILIFSFISYEYVKNDWKNSETIWTNTLQFYPDSKIAYDSRSNYSLQIGEYDKAYQDIQKSLEISPNNPYAMLSLAYYYYYLNQTDSAKHILSLSTHIKMYNREFSELNGMVYIKEGNYQRAKKYYNSLSELYPNEFYFRKVNAQLHFLNKEYDKSIAEFTASIFIKPNYSRNYYFRFLSYLMIGNHKEALIDLEKIKETDVYSEKSDLIKKIRKVMD
jgi:tetratricopeptide (TPR) repeat protein